MPKSREIDDEREHLALSPAEAARQQERHRRVIYSLTRLAYLVLLVTVTLLPFVASVTKDDVRFSDYAIAFTGIFIFGVGVLVADALTPNRRLATLFAVYLGLLVGIVGALALGWLIDLVVGSWDLEQLPNARVYALLVKLAIGITICYLTISTVLTTKDDLRLVIPYVEFAKQVRGVRPILLDTSVLIDGRIERFAETGFLDAPVIVPQFVVTELQALADSGDKLKRARGRRGLDMVSTLQLATGLDLTLDASDPPGHAVDHKLIVMASEQNMRIMTTDHNLEKVARIQNVGVLNLNEVAQSLRPQVLTGDKITVEINKRGEGPNQGVGYLPDGTMVVVEHAAARIGDMLPIVVTNAMQTSAGRLIFGQIDADDDAQVRQESMHDSATHQARATERPPRPGSRSKSPRNPRRG